jgi:hypothetical protein
MSRAKTINQKRRKSARTKDQKELARKIKQGLLPRFIFVRAKDKNLARGPSRKKRGGKVRNGDLTLKLTKWTSIDEGSGT